MAQELAVMEQPLSADIERVRLTGDLSKLTPDQRLSYYNATCKSLGLNPLTKPFAYIQLNGKTVLYALKDATEQLRTIHNISLLIPARELHDDVYVVTARAVRSDGRQDESTGAVSIGGLKGEAKANAMMKAETKAKRRVTLSICGLGMLDETEVETIPGAYDPQELAAVRDRRIAEETAKLAQPKAAKDGVTEADLAPLLEQSIQQAQERKADPPPATNGTAANFKMLETFKKIKGDLHKITGDDKAYYSVLGANGFEKSNQIDTIERGREIHKEMVQRLNDEIEHLGKKEPANAR